MSSNLITQSSSETSRPAKVLNNFKTSLCIPSSAISHANASNLQHITHVAYQIAKAAISFNVSEIVVLEVPDKTEQLENDESEFCVVQGNQGNQKIKFDNSTEERAQSVRPEETGTSSSAKNENSALLLASLLQYFVTPKYLVQSVFRANPCRAKFIYAEKLPKISTLPFMSSNAIGGAYKEGFTVSKKAPKVRKRNKKVSAVKKLKVTKYVNVGGSRLVELSGPEVPINVRVTVDMKNKKVVSPEQAYGTSGCKASFGYHVRIAKTITSVFTELSYPEGYTESIFVNADNYFKGSPLTQLPRKSGEWRGQNLIVIANLRDLKYVFEQESIEGVDSITEMFDAEMAVPAGLRIEDAAFVSMAMLV
ncbi:hypothetical protein HF325_006159 [Metschnikowia pulcherrima]|uniref:Uncharacterized protein n=1 Tax=Metschnikowia pulcherrima TaxID=27326 RepID=A0A8H7GPS9_9ASCO|nr:hypothetical protein HF325_006159 [Metschnikowia pulcherrima]